ncbi:MAG: OmpA family protein [Acidobacteria bacterium]|nr:OmpA family protein [Acidobacteriota bacterium]
MKKSGFLGLIFLALAGISCSLFDEQGESGSNSNVTPTPESTATPVKEEAGTSTITDTNYLSFASGAALLKFPVPASMQFSSHNILDGGEAFWISREGEGTDQEFVISLPGETIFKKFSFINGNDYYGEGSNAKDILIEVSNISADSGFQKILETSLPSDIDPDKLFVVEAELPARYLKLTVKNSVGNPQRVSLGEIKGYGTQKTSDSLSGLTGTYRAVDQDETTLKWTALTPEEMKAQGLYSDIYLRQKGTSLTGCEEQGDFDYFTGGIDGNVAQLLWHYVPEDPVRHVVTSFGENGKYMFVVHLNEEGNASIFKAFQKVGETPGRCPNIKGFDQSEAGDSKLKESLEKTGRAIVYGINFDFNSDKLRDESKTVLQEIIKILKENPEWKMVIEGHTDNVGGENFNQGLSERRAASVVEFLTSAGIDASRLSSDGYGYSKPVASNDTELGRARNRRVELLKQ